MMDPKIASPTSARNADRPAPLTSPTSSPLLEQDDFDNLTALMYKAYTPVTDINEIVSNLLGHRREEEKTRLQALRGEEACRVMYSLQTWIDNNPSHKGKWSIVRVLTRIAAESALFPPGLFLSDIKNVSHHWAKKGGFSDVYVGVRDEGRVALKRLIVNDAGRERNRVHRAFCKESLMWRQLTHPNVLPFLGVDGQTFRDACDLAMVSPWLERGTLKQYIRSGAYAPRSHRSYLIDDVAQGLRYLHELNIAHGDFHWNNVLISDDGFAMLTDFGLTIVAEMTQSQTLSSNPTRAGAARWLAPELFSPDPVTSRKSIPADVYAFGRLCLAVCTAQEPLYKMNDLALRVVLGEGAFPGPVAERPSDEECQGYPMSDQLWELAESCCSYAPRDRPTMSYVLTKL